MGAPFYVPAVTRAAELLWNHPRLARALFGRVANAPLASRVLGVLPRAYLGATAFEIHDVDVARGRIALGGVDEIIFSSKFLQLFHHVLAEEMGEDAKDRALYRIGREGGWFEVDRALAGGRWAPRFLSALIDEGALLDRVRSDERMARFFDVVMKMVLRLVINEGGWGAVHSFDYRSSPITIALDDTQEPGWIGAATKPVCRVAAGVVAGYMSRLAGERLEAREVKCRAMGDPRCVFEIDR